jgi:uncharacterized protein YegJ (DUF2314 family)
VVAGALTWALRLARPYVEKFLDRDGAVRVTAPAASSASRPPAPRRVYAERARFEFALYFTPDPARDPRAAFEALLPRYPSLRLGNSGEEPTVTVAKLDLEKYAPPSVEMLRYAGHGLSPAQTEALQHTRSVFGLDFSYRPADGFDVLREAGALMLGLARETGGILWDEETRECYTPDAWEEARVAGWTRGVPHVPKHVTIHYYRTGEFFREVTLGMAKLGLPDVVVNDLAASYSRSIGNLVNLTCQTLAEKGRFDGPGQLTVDIATLEDATLRDSLRTSLEKGATGKADLTLVEGVREEGDADNRLLEIVFPREEGVHLQEAHDALIATLFGVSDAIQYVQHDTELLEASRTQKSKLPALAARFRRGLQPGERILLKAPFKTDGGGHEWMWVEVVVWNGERIEGTLQNTPMEVSDLKAGARVRFAQSDVFDFLHYFPDGHIEGNETGKIMAKREGVPYPRETGK